MNVLLTGAAGFIGSHTCEALLARGWRVRAVDNLSSGRRENLPVDPRIELRVADVRDRDAMNAAAAGMDAVLHLAAQVSVQASVADPVGSAGHNVTGFLNVLDAARTAGVKRVVYASSAAVYGIPAALPLDEASPTAPLSPYGLEKSIDDQYAALYAALYGTRALGLRYFNVYGPRQDPRSPYAGVISKFVDCARRGDPVRIFGDGLQTRDFIYVKDIAEANARALAADATGVCNVGTGRSVTLLQMVDALEQVFGRAIERRFEPPAAGDIRDSAMRPERLRALLGFTPATALVDGLRALAKGTA
jgi:UDP-glucose 4-epimerase